MIYQHFQFINIMNIFRLQLQKSTSKYASHKTICSKHRCVEDKINIVNCNYLYKYKKKDDVCKKVNVCNQLFYIVYVCPTSSIHKLGVNFLFFSLYVARQSILHKNLFNPQLTCLIARM